MEDGGEYHKVRLVPWSQMHYGRCDHEVLKPLACIGVGPLSMS